MIDITEATEAAARAAVEADPHEITWDDLSSDAKHRVLEAMLPIVSAVVQVLIPDWKTRR